MGPFVITNQLSPVTFQLQLPKSMRIHNQFHMNQLKAYVDESIYKQELSPVPEPVVPTEPTAQEGELEYYFDKILKHRIRYRKYEFLIKWQGETDAQATWQRRWKIEEDQPKAMHQEYYFKYEFIEVVCFVTFGNKVGGKLLQ